MFRLAPVRAKLLQGLWTSNGTENGSELITPSLDVLPMGWSWAMHLMQLVSEEALHRSGLGPQSLVRDRSVPPSLEVPVGAAYVDNYLVAG